MPFEPYAYPTIDAFAYAPVAAGMWRQHEVFDGTYDFDDLLDAHEIMAVFQSTLLAWGATVEVFTQGIQRIISIQAPRMGSD